MLKIFVFIDIWFVKQHIQEWLKTKIFCFYGEFENEQKKDKKKILPSGAGIWTPDFQQFSHPWFNIMGIEEDEIKCRHGS